MSASNSYSFKAVAKRFISISFLICYMFWIVSSSHAATVVLQWGANTEPDLAGYKVYYKADSSSLPFDGIGATEGSSPIDVHNQTSTTISGLDPAHAYYFAITAYNTSGVESSYSNIVSISETASPTASITVPSNNSNVSGTVSVTASASDNVGVTRVEYYLNGVLVGSDTTAPYLYSWNTTAVTPGVYNLFVKAYDAAGNVGQSSTVTVTVVNDVTAPTASITTPANSAVLSGAVTISAAASDNVGISKVEFYLNGVLQTAMNTVPYSYIWNTATVSNGSYAIIAKAYDTANNATTSSTVNVTVNNQVADVTAPVVTAFTIPATASSLTLAISSFTASDSTGVTGYLLTESSTAPSAGAAGWTASVPASYTFASAGSKTLYAWAKDAAGNVSSSINRSVTISLPDTTAPVVVINSVTSPTTATSQTLSGSVTDNVGVASVTVQVGSAVAYAATLSGNSWSFNLSGLTVGTNNITVRANDASGNSSTATTVIVVDTLTLADATMAMQVAVGKISPSNDQKSRLDVAPVINGKSSPNGKVDTGDAIVILSKVVGKITL